MSNYHDREASVALLKAALGAGRGKPMYCFEKDDCPDDILKGDAPGHEFRGNQYRDGGAAAAKARVFEERSNVTSARAKSSSSKIQENHVVAEQDARAARDAHAEAARQAIGKEVAEHHTGREMAMSSRTYEHYNRARGDK